MRSKIECHFVKHDLERVCQGDLLRDLKFNYILKSNEVQEFYFPYSLVITQDCDLDQFQKKCNEVKEGDIFNQYLTSLLIIPAFTAESLKSGNHIIDLFNYKHDSIPTKNWKLVIQNNNDRYHYINNYVDLQIPDLVCDFKHFFTVSYELVKEQYTDIYRKR